MNPYVDANILVSFYLPRAASQDANGLLTGRASRQAWPLQVSTLLRLEFLNALERMVFEARAGSRWRVTPEAAAVARAEFAETLTRGVFLRPVQLTLEDLEPHFEDLVARHTAKHGFRTYDILHVASALYLGCDTFWSLDAKALKLARLEGLKTNR